MWNQQPGMQTPIYVIIVQRNQGGSHADQYIRGHIVKVIQCEIGDYLDEDSYRKHFAPYTNSGPPYHECIILRREPPSPVRDSDEIERETL